MHKRMSEASAPIAGVTRTERSAPRSVRWLRTTALGRIARQHARDLADSLRCITMNDFESPHELAKGTPRRIQTVYAYAFFTAALLAVVAFGLSQIPPITSGLAASCRALHLCSLPP